MDTKQDTTPKANGKAELPEGMKTYRVFTTRHYIAVEWFDVIAKTPRRACNLAEQAAYKVNPDPRAKAVDNGWLSDDPTPIESIGSGSGEYTMEAVELKKLNEGESVFHNKD